MHININIGTNEKEINPKTKKKLTPEQKAKLKKAIKTGTEKYETYMRELSIQGAAALRYAKDLKDRYTVLWLNYDLLGDPRGADI